MKKEMSMKEYVELMKRYIVLAQVKINALNKELEYYKLKSKYVFEPIDGLDYAVYGLEQELQKEKELDSISKMSDLAKRTREEVGKLKENTNKK